MHVFNILRNEYFMQKMIFSLGKLWSSILNSERCARFPFAFDLYHWIPYVEETKRLKRGKIIFENTQTEAIRRYHIQDLKFSPSLGTL